MISKKPFVTLYDLSRLIFIVAMTYSVSFDTFDCVLLSCAVGKLTIKTFTQYNRLGNIEYTYIPINKKETTTVFIERKFLPYFGIGLSTFPSYDAEIGLFYRKSFGFSIEGNYYPKPLTDDMLKYSIGMKVLKMF